MAEGGTGIALETEAGSLPFPYFTSRRPAGAATSPARGVSPSADSGEDGPDDAGVSAVRFSHIAQYWRRRAAAAEGAADGAAAQRPAGAGARPWAPRAAEAGDGKQSPCAAAGDAQTPSAGCRTPSTAAPSPSSDASAQLLAAPDVWLSDLQAAPSCRSTARSPTRPAAASSGSPAPAPPAAVPESWSPAPARPAASDVWLGDLASPARSPAWRAAPASPAVPESPFSLGTVPESPFSLGTVTPSRHESPFSPSTPSASRRGAHSPEVYARSATPPRSSPPSGSSHQGRATSISTPESRSRAWPTSIATPDSWVLGGSSEAGGDDLWSDDAEMELALDLMNHVSPDVADMLIGRLRLTDAAYCDAQERRREAEGRLASAPASSPQQAARPRPPARRPPGAGLALALALLGLAVLALSAALMVAPEEVPPEGAEPLNASCPALVQEVASYAHEPAEPAEPAPLPVCDAATEFWGLRECEAVKRAAAAEAERLRAERRELGTGHAAALAAMREWPAFLSRVWGERLIQDNMDVHMELKKSELEAHCLEAAKPGRKLLEALLPPPPRRASRGR